MSRRLYRYRIKGIKPYFLMARILRRYRLSGSEFQTYMVLICSRRSLTAKQVSQALGKTESLTRVNLNHLMILGLITRKLK